MPGQQCPGCYPNPRPILSTYDETPARPVVERMAHAFQAALMVAHAPAEVAAAFCATRLGDGWRGDFGGGAADLPVHAVVDRARLAS